MVLGPGLGECRIGLRRGGHGFGGGQQGGPALEELRGEPIAIAQPAQLPL